MGNPSTCWSAWDLRWRKSLTALGVVEKVIKGFLCLAGSCGSPGDYQTHLGSREVFLALPSNCFSPWAVHRSIRKSLSPAGRSSEAELGWKEGVVPLGVRLRNSQSCPAELCEVSQGFQGTEQSFQECYNLLCQVLLTLLSCRGNIHQHFGGKDKQIVRVWGIAWDILFLRRVTKNNKAWSSWEPGEQICLPGQFPAPSGGFEGDEDQIIQAESKIHLGSSELLGENPTWPLQLNIFNHIGVTQFDMKGIYQRKLLLHWKLKRILFKTSLLAFLS